MPDLIMDATADTFQAVVVDQSFDRPVVVDFWAPWCEPCHALAPVLEEAVKAREGNVALVKVNVDENQSLAAQFGIRGIPAVKVFYEGNVIDEFTGAVDRHGVDLVLDRAIPSDGQRILSRARALLAAGQSKEVPALLDPVASDPANQDEALLLIAKAYLAEKQLAKALESLGSIDPKSPIFDEADALRVQVQLVEEASKASFESCDARIAANAGDLEARWAAAGHLLERGDHAAALDQLMAILQADRSFQQDGARRAMISIFGLLGGDHPLTSTYRRRMQIYL